MIVPGVERINHTGGVIAGALPLLYGMAEGIVVGATYQPAAATAERQPARPASGRRRSRLHDGVGYSPAAASASAPTAIAEPAAAPAGPAEPAPDVFSRRSVATSATEPRENSIGGRRVAGRAGCRAVGVRGSLGRARW